MKYFALLTKLGENLLAQATALGTKLELTHMAVGDGGGSLPTPDTNQTKLIAEKRRAAINTLFIDDKNKNQIIAEQIIPEQDGGWWIREIGLFDKAGNLIAVANCPETYKPQLAEGSGRTQSIRMVLIVSHTESVTLKIDPSVVLATRKYVEENFYPKEGRLKHRDSATKDTVLVTESERGGFFLNNNLVSGFFDYSQNKTLWGFNNEGRMQYGLIPVSCGGTGAVNASDARKNLQLDSVYLRIENPATSAKKLTTPSRIAGHTFQGQGEDIKISAQDVNAYPLDGRLKHRTSATKDTALVTENERGGLFINNNMASGFYDYEQSKTLWGFNNEGAMQYGLIPVSCGGTGAVNASDARKNLQLDSVYLRIENPATSAKKLTTPSRIAGHTFQGQGEDIKISAQDVNAYPLDGRLKHRTSATKDTALVTENERGGLFINNNMASGFYDYEQSKTLWGFNNEGAMQYGLIPVSCGGTGAVNASDARKNLGVNEIFVQGVRLSQERIVYYGDVPEKWSRNSGEVLIDVQRYDSPVNKGHLNFGKYATLQYNINGVWVSVK
ncbi:phage tail protein [Providencia rettgeri]|uniref:phage tail protein n=1 Tax=Providencia rettgeri TaxID=587 RepID=UPI003CE8941B